MSANPLQDNGIPKYDWFRRIAATIIIAERCGQIKLDAQGRVLSHSRSVKQAIRHEIVRVAKDFVGKTKWKTQKGDKANA